MERFSTCDLREKEVINLCDGTRLGCPTDFEFEAREGRITALIICVPGGFLGLGQSKDITIPWNKIECIGSDAILVRLTPAECFIPEKKKKKPIF